MIGDRRIKNQGAFIDVRPERSVDSAHWGEKYDESIQIETDGTRRNLDSWGAIADIHCNLSIDDGDGQWSFQ